MDNTQERIIKLIAEHLGLPIDSILPDHGFSELPMDSLDHVMLLMGVEDEFRIEIPDDDAEKWTSVADAVAYVRGRKP